MVHVPEPVRPRFAQQETDIRSQIEEKITNWVAPDDKTGEFKRGQSQFRNWIKKGGEFPPEKGRYHLYV
jgi:glutathionyl-hydroquinone reductase